MQIKENILLSINPMYNSILYERRVIKTDYFIMAVVRVTPKLSCQNPFGRTHDLFLDYINGYWRISRIDPLPDFTIVDC